jgi:hypothetical protein
MIFRSELEALKRPATSLSFRALRPSLFSSRPNSSLIAKMSKYDYINGMQKTLLPIPKKANFKISLFRTVVLLLATTFFFSSTLLAAVRANGKCTTSDPMQKPGTVKNHTICVDGTTQRWYLLFLPSSYTSSTQQPLIVSYHGGTRNASNQLTLDNFTSPKYNESTIVVYPQGLNVS